jgi:hypothetical protein
MAARRNPTEFFVFLLHLCDADRVGRLDPSGCEAVLVRSRREAMAGRRNDGVKMTSQLATKNTHSLGITTDDAMLDRYLETINPGRPSIDDHLGAIETPSLWFSAITDDTKSNLFISRTSITSFGKTR